MALEIKVGDMFTETLNKKGVMIVHGCNAQGVMGSGVAALVKKLYPYAFLCYKQVHRRHGLRLGGVVVAPFPGGDGPTVLNAITQEFYGRDGKPYASYDAVVVAMQAVAKLAKDEGNVPVHLPMIGGGLGGLDPKRLTAIFQAAFHDTNATLWLKED